MKKIVQKHAWYYLVFLGFELIGLAFIFLFTYNKPIQILVIISMLSFYLVWTILHHYFHHTLTKKIVLEYVLIGLLGALALLFVLL